MGYRFAIFNYATQALGGAVTRQAVRADHALTGAADASPRPPRPTHRPERQNHESAETTRPRRACRCCSRCWPRRTWPAPAAATALVTLAGPPTPATTLGASAAETGPLLRRRRRRRAGSATRTYIGDPGPRVQHDHAGERDEVGRHRAVPGHVQLQSAATRSSTHARPTVSGCAATPWCGTRSCPAGRRACPAARCAAR